jgi:transposase, IS5 family
MRQQSLAAIGFERFNKKTRKEIFLGKMEKVIPWNELSAAIEPFYPKPEGAGRRPIGVERMLRIFFLQHWFQLSDPGVEDALYDSRALRDFVGIDLGNEPVPDETTILKFRHLMEKHNLGEQLFVLTNQYLEENGFRVSRGTIVDATIIDAPSSTKNKDKSRDPEMKSTKKGNQWYFGMKAHIGVDSKTKLIHSVAVTSANVHDSQVVDDLLHGDETRLYGDSAYAGQKEKIAAVAPSVKDFTNKKGHRNQPLSAEERGKNKTKSSVRAKVEHMFHIIKRQFGYVKVRYRGLKKNANSLFAICALANLEMASRRWKLA